MEATIELDHISHHQFPILQGIDQNWWQEQQTIHWGIHIDESQSVEGCDIDEMKRMVLHQI